LFGSAQRNTNNLDDLGDLILLNEKIDFKIFNKAILAIVNAKCIIADPVFSELKVGSSLIDYVVTGCPFMTIEKKDEV